MELNNSEKKELLDLAKAVIIETAGGGEIREYTCENKKLEEDGAAFVTIDKDNRLRGCIGHMEAVSPLYKTVREMAMSAAKDDPRFPPVEKDELPSLTVEITVLSPLKAIEDIEEIEVGKHGLWIEKGYYRGVLLPQVAVEYGWDRETFLNHTAMKAGLSPDGWKNEDTIIKIFSGEVFGNEKVLED